MRTAQPARIRSKTEPESPQHHVGPSTGPGLLHMPYEATFHQKGRCEATWKRGFKLPWREAGPPTWRLQTSRFSIKHSLSLLYGGSALAGQRECWVLGTFGVGVPGRGPPREHAQRDPSRAAPTSLTKEVTHATLLLKRVATSQGVATEKSSWNKS